MSDITIDEQIKYLLCGVKAGMLRAAEICKEWEAKLSQGAGYAIRTAREEITRAADQVNADGCTRSHPHENMSAECERKTIEAKNANHRRNAELMGVCQGMINIVERVGCKDWRDENGKRVKDTPEWVSFYVAVHNAAE